MRHTIGCDTFSDTVLLLVERLTQSTFNLIVLEMHACLQIHLKLGQPVVLIFVFAQKYPKDYLNKHCLDENHNSDKNKFRQYFSNIVNQKYNGNCKCDVKGINLWNYNSYSLISDFFSLFLKEITQINNYTDFIWLQINIIGCMLAKKLPLQFLNNIYSCYFTIMALTCLPVTNQFRCN